MATYRSIATTETDPQAPITSALMKALEANPTAISEGATGAPRVLGKALGSTFLGGNALSGTTPQRWSNLDAMETIKIEGPWGSLINGAAIQIRFSNDNGASFGSYQTLVTNGTGATINVGTLLAYVNLRTGAQFSAATGSTTATLTNNAALTVPSNCNCFEIRCSSGGSFTAGILAWCLGGLQ
jgi:hypothetical protein